MKRVLISGATGFIGRYVVEEVLARGHDVIATSSNEERAKEQPWYKRVSYIPFDINRLESDKDYYRFFQQPDLLIHLAWEGLPNYKSPFHLEHNLPLHFRFLSQLVKCGLSDITSTGTCFEYGMQEGCLSEHMPAQPTNAYAIAKNSLREQLEVLKAETPFNLKWIRLFYMYGRGQSPNSLLSQLQTAIDRGDTVFNMSPGDQLRDYLPVETVARYVVSIALQEQEGIINCCSGKPIAVKDLVTDYIKKQGAAISLNLGYYPYSDLEPRNFWGDEQKLKTILIHE